MRMSQFVDQLGEGVTWLAPQRRNESVFSASFLAPAPEAAPGVIYACSPERILPLESFAGNILCCLGDGSEDPGELERLAAWQESCGAVNLIVCAGGLEEYLSRALQLLEEQGSLAASVTELVRISSAGQGLSALLARAGELTGVPLVIIDNAYRIMACTKSFGDIGPTYAAIMSKGRILDSVVKGMNEARVYQTMRYFKDLCLFENPDDGTHWLDRLIYVDGVEVAHFGAVVDPDDPLRHYPLISFLCELVAIELQKESFFAYGSNVMADVLMRELIDGTATEERVKIAVDRLGWTVPERMEVLVVAAKSGMIERSHAFAVARRLVEGRKGSHQAFLDGRMVIIEPVPGGRAARAAETDAAQRELVGILESEGLVAAISDPFVRLSDVARAYGQATRALEGFVAGRVSGPVITYGAWALADICDELSKSDHARDFCPEGVLRLAADDRQMGRDWLNTLEAFLRYDHDPNRAAESVHVHRNTLFYRIGCIRERYGLDLDDGQQRLRIMLGIQLAKSMSPA